MVHAVLGIYIHVGVSHPRSDSEFVLMLAWCPLPHPVNPNGKIIASEYRVKGSKGVARQIKYVLQESEHVYIFNHSREFDQLSSYQYSKKTLHHVVIHPEVCIIHDLNELFWSRQFDKVHVALKQIWNICY